MQELCANNLCCIKRLLTVVYVPDLELGPTRSEMTFK